ncbi:aldose 1-epimerase family protein [Microlunatus soli]|uniref:Aldose 1-epimerase n=1 Tax=Microlunatus soli TaxID=630515 RepID=A0A1H1ZNC5_9ACTN|nr:aldose 1-epimerase family protein [Microlunatus soli]SDT34726.1 aldose 1-epimerase [Microlunatus soli]
MTSSDSTGTTPAPSGEQYEITSGSYRAVITEVGATLRLLQVDGKNILAGFAEGDRISGGHGQQLLPWPNRIRDGRYSFGGQEQQLALSEPERHNAIHGLVRWLPWNVVEHTADTVVQQVTLHPQQGWDTTLLCTITHQLSDRGLTVTVAARNVGDVAAPFGYAAHPYFTLGESAVDQVEISAPASSYLEVDDRLLPVAVRPVDGLDEDLRTAAPLAARDFDTAFTALATDGDQPWRVRLALGERETFIWGDEKHRWIQIYTGAGKRDLGIAVEPMTCGPDAFNTDLTSDGLIVLEPGDQYEGTWGVYGR